MLCPSRVLLATCIGVAVLTPDLASDSPLGHALQPVPYILWEPPFRSESIFFLSGLIEKVFGLELEVGNCCPKPRKALLTVSWVPCCYLGRQRHSDAQTRGPEALLWAPATSVSVGEGALFRGWHAATFCSLLLLWHLHQLICFPGQLNVAFSSSSEFLFVPSVLNFQFSLILIF